MTTHLQEERFGISFFGDIVEYVADNLTIDEVYNKEQIKEFFENWAEDHGYLSEDGLDDWAIDNGYVKEKS